MAELVIQDSQVFDRLQNAETAGPLEHPLLCRLPDLQRFAVRLVNNITIFAYSVRQYEVAMFVGDVDFDEMIISWDTLPTTRSDQDRRLQKQLTKSKQRTLLIRRST